MTISFWNNKYTNTLIPCGCYTHVDEARCKREWSPLLLFWELFKDSLIGDDVILTEGNTYCESMQTAKHVCTFCCISHRGLNKTVLYSYHKTFLYKLEETEENFHCFSFYMAEKTRKGHLHLYVQAKVAMDGGVEVPINFWKYINTIF